jgi:hypothetical protein
MRKPQHRHCEGPCCGRVFVPRQRNQRYCQPSCWAAADLRRLNGQADTHAQISAKMLNEAFYSYNKPRDVPRLAHMGIGTEADEGDEASVT